MNHELKNTYDFKWDGKRLAFKLDSGREVWRDLTEEEKGKVQRQLDILGREICMEVLFKNNTYGAIRIREEF